MISFFKRFFSTLTTKKAIFIIVIIGFIVFGNALFNGFVFDDNGQILRNSTIHSVVNIPNIFLNKFIGQDTNNYYRPLPYVLYAILHSLFQHNAFPYHLIQILFHIGNSLLIFLIFKRFLKQNLSFFISILFLVHPINEETVVYIANLPDILFLFFGLLSLYLLQKDSKKVIYIILANISLLLSLFSKETGILFFVITILFLFFFKKNRLLFQIIASFSIGLFYLFLRILLHVPLQKPAIIPIMKLLFWERMVNVPAIIFYYLRIFIFPKDLASLHTWTINKIQFTNFFLPLLIVSVFFIILFLMCLFTYKRRKGKKLLIFFSIWLTLGLAIHLQIIPIDMTVADHYFYFPIVGLLGLIGLFFQEIRVNRLITMLVMLLGIIILLTFSVRTMIRNTNWKNQSVLLSHDEQLSQNDYLQELMYGNDLIKSDNDKEALPHIQKSVTLYPQSSLAWNSLGIIYYKTGDIQNAKKSFQKSISVGNYYGAYENMALLLLDHDNIFKAREFIRKATTLYSNSEKLWYYRLLAEYQTKDYNGALLAAKYFYLLRQDEESYTIYTHLQQGLPIQIE